MTPEKTTTIVEAASAKARLDIYVSQITENTTRSYAKILIDTGKVLLNAAPSKASQKLKAGDIVEVTLEEAIPLDTPAEDLPVEILYEDESIVVVNKAAMMVVHPAAGNYTGTLVNALLFHLTDLSGIGGVMRPGIVHRLDKGTSGVMVVAKNDEAHLSLTAQFKDRAVTKKYLALVLGRMPAANGVIESEIGRDNKNRKKISSNSSNKKEAVTFYEVKKVLDRFSLLELTPKTGRTHQIRVHLSESGHPIVGDELYGGVKRLHSIPDTLLRKRLKELDRFLLHAAYLSFAHPKTNERVEFSAPLPDDFLSVLAMLE